MPEDEGKSRLGSIREFFSKIGKGVTRTGEVTKETPTRVKKAVKREPTPEEEEVGLSERLRELKRLETEGPEVREELAWEEEEEEWEEEREELERPVSERLAEIFYKPLKAPAKRLAGSLGGLEEELYRARMDISVEKFAAFMLGVSAIAGVLGFILGWLFLSPLFALLAAVVGSMVGLLLTRRQPKLKIQSRVDEVNQSLPYGLRHISTQLSSGIGLSEAMNSVARADYGTLSQEFNRTLQDMRTGASMMEALEAMTDRVGSDPLNRAIRQIQRTMRTGGNLSNTLGELADEAAYELRMEVRGYTQSLGMMTMIYMFAAAVIPPLFIVLLIVMQSIGGASVSTSLFAVMYLLAIPFLLFYLVTIFKKMEPGV